MYQALYRKWRPKTFSDVVGQEHVTETLQRQVAEGRLSHAYLFTGTRGTGKTTCAKILAKAVNCEHPENGNPCNKCSSCLGIESGGFLDVMELDAASNNGVDHVRALRDEAIYSPAQVKKRVYIIDEVHMLSIAAFNALLKILEEPPEHLMFILATTELHKVPATILSRCQRFAFRRILPREIGGRLNYIAEQEGIDLRPDGAELLAHIADGALRDALSLLDQCAAAGGTIDSAAVLDALGLAGNLQTAQLMDCVLRRDTKAALLLLHRLYGSGKDVGAVLGELSALARDLLISKTAPEGGAALLTGGYDSQTMDGLLRQADSARLIAICTTLQRAAADMNVSVNRRTDAELCLLKLCDETLSGDLSAINARLARLEQQMATGVRYAAAESTAQVVPAPAEKPAPARAAAKPTAVEDEAPPPWEDSAPAPADGSFDDAPPPYGEPAEPERPQSAMTAPAPQAAEPKAEASAPTGDSDIWLALMESYKNRLTPDKRAFVGQADGRLANGVLTVYCPTAVTKAMLDTEAVAAVLREVTGQSVGRAVAVRFMVGEPEDGKKRDKFQDLLRMGSKFDNFNIK